MMKAPSKSTVLVIDDEPQIRRLLRVTLEGDNYRVFEAGTGNEGLVEAASRRPEIILLDLGLPDLPGLSGSPTPARMDQGSSSHPLRQGP